MKLIFSLAILFFLCSVASAETKINIHGLPIHNLLKSVKTQDKDLLKSSFSKRMVKNLGNGPGWAESLKQYTLLFKKEFGNYQMSDFKYKFIPSKNDPKKGQVSIIFKGKKLEGLRVIKEGDSWKMDER